MLRKPQLMESAVLFFMPSKQLPYTYNAIIRTGMASTPDMPPLDQVGKNVVLPPFSEVIPEMEEERLRGLLISHISIFLHNALVAKDFPANGRLKNLFKSSEKKLSRIRKNPWMAIMLEYGRRGECPIPEDLDNNLDPVDRVALSMARPEWEDTVPKMIVHFVDWFIDNRKAVEDWHLDRLKVFA